MIPQVCLIVLGLVIGALIAAGAVAERRVTRTARHRRGTVS
ncbi:hypothetical protein [Streptomyces sp. NBC_01506]